MLNISTLKTPQNSWHSETNKPKFDSYSYNFLICLFQKLKKKISGCKQYNYNVAQLPAIAIRRKLSIWVTETAEIYPLTHMCEYCSSHLVCRYKRSLRSTKSYWYKASLPTCLFKSHKTAQNCISVFQIYLQAPSNLGPYDK